MIVKLTDDEVRELLFEAVQKKMDYSGSFSLYSCWFDVLSPDGEVQDIEEVTFSCEVIK